MNTDKYKWASLAVLVGAGLATCGCGDLLTLHSLYTRQDQVIDPVIEGRWESKDNRLEVRRNEQQYDVVSTGKESTEPPSKFEMHLVDLNGVRFADLLPEDHIGHMILRVRQNQDELRVDFMDSPWLRQQVRHDYADVENFRKTDMLTQPTPQLRALVAKFARESKSFADELVFRRIK